MEQIDLTPEEEAEAARIEDILLGKARVEIRYVSRLLASKCNRELFGETEFQVREAVQRLGAQGLDAALAERKKRGTRGRASSARTAAKTPGSTATADAG